MAVISVDFHSESLQRFTNFKMILPNDVPAPVAQQNPHYQRPTKTLILLHGYSGGNNVWIWNTNIVELAGMYNLAVICPDGENGFYLNGQETGRQYQTLIGEELVRYASKTFGLSAAREDVFIGGFSMGGFGALHTALACPEQFSKVLSFSAALINGDVAKMQPGSFDGIANYEYYRLVFGDPATLSDSENAPETLVKKNIAEGRKLPELFLCVGTEDFLYEKNTRFRHFLEEQQVPFTYAEGPGVHNFRFVNSQLQRAFDFLFPEKQESH